MKLIGRNDLCWCGSGKKYKSCHLDFDTKLEEFKTKGISIPSRNMIKNDEQIEGIRQSGIINTAILDMVTENIKEGMTTEEINVLVHEFTISHGAIPATLNYNGFPKSVCTSLNDEICHGIPSKDITLKNGDIINVDVTTIYKGYFADASRMFLIGDVDEKAKKLVRITKECVDMAVEGVKPWGYIGDIGAIIDGYAKKNGYTVVRDIGGHGVGIAFHEEPYVCHIGVKDTGVLLVPGMVFTIEPMINMGSGKFFEDADNGWTIYTDDGSLSAQWEYTVVVKDDKLEILTH